MTAHSWFLHTIPLLRLFPGRPSSIFSSLTAFLGGIFFLELAKAREVTRNGTGKVQWVCRRRSIPIAVLAAARSKLWVIETNKQLLDRREVVLALGRNLKFLNCGNTSHCWNYSLMKKVSTVRFVVAARPSSDESAALRQLQTLTFCHSALQTSTLYHEDQEASSCPALWRTSSTPSISRISEKSMMLNC